MDDYIYKEKEREIFGRNFEEEAREKNSSKVERGSIIPRALFVRIMANSWWLRLFNGDRDYVRGKFPLSLPLSLSHSHP